MSNNAKSGQNDDDDSESSSSSSINSFLLSKFAPNPTAAPANADRNAAATCSSIARSFALAKIPPRTSRTIVQVECISSALHAFVSWQIARGGTRTKTSSLARLSYSEMLRVLEFAATEFAFHAVPQGSKRTNDERVPKHIRIVEFAALNVDRGITMSHRLFADAQHYGVNTQFIDRFSVLGFCEALGGETEVCRTRFQATAGTLVIDATVALEEYGDGSAPPAPMEFAYFTRRQRLPVIRGEGDNVLERNEQQQLYNGVTYVPPTAVCFVAHLVPTPPGERNRRFLRLTGRQVVTVAEEMTKDRNLVEEAAHQCDS